MRVSIGVSNRHVHLNEEDYKLIFGDATLEVDKDLVQKRQFASKSKVTIKTPKNEINNVRVLGPLRDYDQVEISKTDAYFLGLNPPIRNSGDLLDAVEIEIVGPCGSIKRNAAIIATRHIHINKEDRIKYNLQDKEYVKAKIGNEKTSIIEDVYIKESPNGVFELHIDTDDANGNFVKSGDYAELIID